MMNQADISLSGATVEEARTMMDQAADLAGAEPVELGSVEEVTIDAEHAELPARVYAPEGAEDLPTVVFYHGGGFVIGNVDTHDNLCRLIADRADAVVISVEYRLAPEHPFPAAVKDAYAAARWASGNADEHGGDGSSLAVAGDSAGGTLSAVVSLMARDRGMPRIDAQCLLYPATAYMEPMESRAQNAEGYFLESEDMMWFVDKYIEDGIDARHPYSMPLQVRSVEDVPPALVVTCEFDPLRDEGQAYADRLEDAGVAVERVHYDGMIHGFLNMEGLVDRAYDGVDAVASFLDDTLE